MKTVFPRRLWHWTRASENLFNMSRDDLATYALLCTELAN